MLSLSRLAPMVIFGSLDPRRYHPANPSTEYNPFAKKIFENDRGLKHHSRTQLIASSLVMFAEEKRVTPINLTEMNQEREHNQNNQTRAKRGGRRLFHRDEHLIITLPQRRRRPKRHSGSLNGTGATTTPELSRAIITLFHKREVAEQVSDRNALPRRAKLTIRLSTCTYRVVI